MREREREGEREGGREREREVGGGGSIDRPQKTWTDANRLEKKKTKTGRGDKDTEIARDKHRRTDNRQSHRQSMK